MTQNFKKIGGNFWVFQFEKLILKEKKMYSKDNFAGKFVENIRRLQKKVRQKINEKQGRKYAKYKGNNSEKRVEKLVKIEAEKGEFW